MKFDSKKYVDTQFFFSQLSLFLSDNIIHSITSDNNVISNRKWFSKMIVVRIRAIVKIQYKLLKYNLRQLLLRERKVRALLAIEIFLPQKDVFSIRVRRYFFIGNYPFFSLDLSLLFHDTYIACNRR